MEGLLVAADLLTFVVHLAVQFVAVGMEGEVGREPGRGWGRIERREREREGREREGRERGKIESEGREREGREKKGGREGERVE